MTIWPLILRLAVRLGYREWARAKAGLLIARLTAAVGGPPKETRIIRASGDIYKPGHVLKIDGKQFFITRLLSASPREVLYEAETH